MKKKLNQLLSLGLVLALSISLTACGEKTDTEATEEPVATEEPAEETPETTETEDTGSVDASETAFDPAPPVATEQPADGNLILDGGFDGGKAWDVYTTSGGSGRTSVESGEMRVAISSIGTAEHGVQVFYDGFGLDKGAKYIFSFDARSTLPRTVSCRFQINGGDYHAYKEKKVRLTKEMKNYVIKFTMKEDSDPAPRLCFNMGWVLEGEKGLPEHDVYFDNFSLQVADSSNVVEAVDLSSRPGIRVNQVGFLPNEEKSAVFAGAAAGVDDFTIVDTKTGMTVYTGKFSDVVSNPYAMENDRTADFSDFKTPGKYRIVSADGVESPEFKIADGVYDELFRKAVKMLFMQRCGVALDKKHGGKFAHAKCHTGKAYVYWDEDVKVDVSGGWHDAGDYGRYVAPGAKAAADLLLAYETYKDKKIVDDIGTTESGDGVDDLLQEAKYELDWMLKMQDKEGKIYSKVTCKNFPETCMPEDEKDDLVLSFTSTTAAGDFVGVMSLASRIFAASGVKSLKVAADKYIKAAKKTWKYLAANPKAKGHKNPDGIVTGEYPDEQDLDERFWAACELYKTTGDKSLISFIETYSDDPANMRGLGWTEMGMYGTYAALTDPKLEKASPSAVKAIRDAMNKKVGETIGNIKENTITAYRINRMDEYEWGSNLGIAGDGVLFNMVDRINGPTENRQMAMWQLDYLLGRNACGYCFVTGFGETPTEHPHHRPSQVVGKAVPGMLAGGPNSGLDDPYAKTVFVGRAPAKCYADVDQSYSTNEVAIYWNSPLILLLAGCGAA